MSKEVVEELRDTFEYHEDGYLIRKKNGKPTGQHANKGQRYARVMVNGRYLYAHRVIYVIVKGTIPKGEIDHIDGNRVDNRIENLRDVPASGNQHNRKKSKNNTSGFTGVYWNTKCQKWRVQIRVDNHKISLGHFDDINEAVEVWKKAKIKYHPTSPEAVEYARENDSKDGE